MEAQANGMTTMQVDGTRVRVEFRHRTRFKKNSEMRRFNAITTCTLIGLREPKDIAKMSGTAAGDPIAFVAVGNSICVETDVFSRREGRLRSFRRAVSDCAPLRAVAGELVAQFEVLNAVPEPREEQSMTAEEKRMKWEAGAAIRAERAARNGSGTMPVAAS
jgi:hypothetical protein